MDRIIQSFKAYPDDDLMICRGVVAYQRDMTVTAAYDESYYNKCAGYEGAQIAQAINAGRVALVNKYVGAKTEVLDIGVGSGEFIKNRPHTFGYDVNPKAVEWLKSWNRYSDDLSAFRAFTFWDVIEHVAEPEQYFKHIPVCGCLLTSIPIFADLGLIRESKHYRPGEHLYYFTERGFVGWMALHRFTLLERQDFEIHAGRDNILSFAFVKTN